MKISLLQTNILWNDTDGNTRNAERMIKGTPKSDLYILPETFSTGFMANPEGIKDRGQEVLEWMRRMAKEMDAAIAGSVATKEGEGKMRNRLYFVRPDGTEVHYDKRHLFGYAGEDEHFEAGRERVVTEWRGVRFLLQVCYDLRFPVWSRNTGDYDCIIYVANWPTSRIAVWETLLKARAIENQCYVCGVNRIADPLCPTGIYPFMGRGLRAASPECPEKPEKPEDPGIDYIGRSLVVDAYGKVVVGCRDYSEECIITELDMSRLEQFRKKFPVLADRDLFSIDY